MAEFLYDRDQTTVIVLRVPKRLWDRYEFRHGHYGKAIHDLREHCIDIMSHRLCNVVNWTPDAPDPFFVDQPE